jgi:pyruvate kinase
MKLMTTRTRIIATIGPQNANADSLKDLLAAGMGIARLNGSHNTLKWHQETVTQIQKVSANVPIIFDIPGRKIRTVLTDKPLKFKRDGLIILTTDAKRTAANMIAVSFENLHEFLNPGQVVFADDGTLKFEVEKVSGPEITLRAFMDGQLGSRKGINVPGVDLGPVLVTDKDRTMISFAIDNHLDFIGLSFVESAKHVKMIRDVVGSSQSPKIVSKIENQIGYFNMQEIIEASDAIMIDRGDLSVETDFETVTLRQKAIIRTAQMLSKPVIVATEMLNSMIVNSFPSKAEVSDVTNAVLDGCSATMLSGETAVGSFPIEAVTTMRKIIEHAESFVSSGLIAGLKTPDINRANDATAKAIALICESADIDKIIAVTRSGFAARTLSCLGVNCPIIAVSDVAANSKSFNIYAGVTGVVFPGEFSTSDVSHVSAVLKFLWQQKLIINDEHILVTALAYPTSGKRMNLIETHLVGDLARSLAWQP